MKKLQIFITICLLVVTTSVAAQSNIANHLTQKWQFVNSIDLYNGGVWYNADSINQKFIVFNLSGEYLEYDNDNTRNGYWQLNDDSTRFGIRFSNSNSIQQSIIEPITDFRWIIYEVDENNLIIGIQGRHGIVKYTYSATGRN